MHGMAIIARTPVSGRQNASTCPWIVHAQYVCNAIAGQVQKRPFPSGWVVQPVGCANDAKGLGLEHHVPLLDCWTVRHWSQAAEVQVLQATAESQQKRLQPLQAVPQLHTGLGGIVAKMGP